MAREDVNIKVSANIAEAIQLWKAMEAGPQGMANAIDGMGKKGRASTKGLGDEILGMVGKWGSVTAAIAAARAELEKYLTALREQEQREAKASANVDAAFRPYFVTAGIADRGEQQASIQRMGNVALKQKASLAQAGAAANMLTQFGVPRGEAEGATLDALLELQDVMNVAGGNGETFSKHSLEILKRGGGEINAKSLRDLGIVSKSLTGRAAGFGAGTLDEYANLATAAREGGMDQATGLALFAAIRENLDTKQAHPLFREFAKPGTQKGEAEYRARVTELLGAGGGEGAYARSGAIQDDSVEALITEGQTGAALANAGTKQLTREQIRDRLSSLLGGYTNAQKAAVLKSFDDPLGPDLLYSDEGRVDEAMSTMFRDHGEISGHWADRYREIRAQALGQAPLPTINVRIKGPTGQDVPHEVEAAGIQDR